MDREERVRKPTSRFTFHEKGGTKPTPPPAEPKKKPKWHKEEIKDDCSGDSYITGGFLPILRPTVAHPPPPPPMGAVGGAATGVVRARVAALNAATGAVVTRTFPLLVRTRVVDAETQTDNGTGEVANGTGELRPRPTIWYSGVAIRAPRSRTASQ